MTSRCTDIHSTLGRCKGLDRPADSEVSINCGSRRRRKEQAPEGYKIFDEKEEDCRKVILTPGDSDVALPEHDVNTTALAT